MKSVKSSACRFQTVPLRGEVPTAPDNEVKARFSGSFERARARCQAERAAQPGVTEDHDEVSRRHSHGQHRQADGASHADRGGDPHGRRGGQAADHLPAFDDERAAEEPDTSHHLGCLPRRVEHHEASGESVFETILPDQQEECGPHANQGVRAQPRVPATHRPFQPDQRRQDKRQAQLSQLLPAVTPYFTQAPSAACIIQSPVPRHLFTYSPSNFSRATSWAGLSAAQPSDCLVHLARNDAEILVLPGWRRA